MRTVLALSNEYLEVPYLLDADPTASPVSFAFMLLTDDADDTESADYSEPVEADWQTGSWLAQVNDDASTTYYARILIGSNGVDLAAGTYVVYSRINPAGDEDIIRVLDDVLRVV